MKRVLSGLGVFLVLASMAFVLEAKEAGKKIKYTCQQKCFTHCKLKNEAVKDCQIANPTTVSFKIICACRPLKKGEVLPAFFHNSRLIKTSATSA